MMQEAASFITATFDDVLSIQKIQDGAMELNIEYFDLRAALKSVEKSLTSPLLEKGLQFVMDISPDLPVALKGDKFRLSHVVANFLSNAVKFSPQDSTITLSVTCNNDTCALLCALLVEVIDEGIGISEEHQQHLFKPYMQVNAEEIQNGRGTGLGLSLCRHIISLHGGEVVCKSSVGHGSNFGFHLKLPYSNDEVLDTSSEEDGSDTTGLIIASLGGRGGGGGCSSSEGSRYGHRRRSKRLTEKGSSVSTRFMVLIVDGACCQCLLYIW